MNIFEVETGFDIIPIQVDSAADQVTENKTYRTDKDHKSVVGIALSISRADALPGCKLWVRINGHEVFPKDFEARMLYVQDGAVPPNDRFYKFHEIPVNESEVEIMWQDGGAITPSLYSTGLKLYLLCTKVSKNERV